MKFTINRYYTILIGILCLMATSLEAQQNNSLYFMHGLPQSSQLNPATQPKCGFYLGIPGISSIEINAGNSAVGFSDVLIYDKQVDSTYTFMRNASTRSNFLKKLEKNNNLFGELRVDLFSLGFRVNNTYLSFNVGEHIETRNVVPYDFARYFMEGNINNVGDSTLKSYDFASLGINAMYYHEYSLGVSHEFNNKLTIGLRGKLLYGIANLTTQSSELSMLNQKNPGELAYYKIHSVVDINGSIPNLSVYTDPAGKIDSLTFKKINSADEARSILTNTNNMGLAFDIGAIYKPIEKLSLSLSILDLGYIKWKDNLQSFKQDATYDFKGLIMHANDSIDLTQAMIDTLKSKFTYRRDTDPFTTSLSPKLYAGALYQLTKGIGFGFLTRQQIIDKNLHSQYSLSVNLYPANAINFTVSYTIADQMYDNFGFGMSFKFLCFQTYIMSERIPLYWNLVKFSSGEPKVPVPAYAKSFNLHWGMNLAFGYRHRAKKLNRDKPLVDLD
jgi:hypothetical protein